MVEILSDTRDEALTEVSFEPEFYIRTYPDVKEASVDPEEHYFAFGLGERRYGSSEQLSADFEAIRSSGLFSFDYFNRKNGLSDDPIRDYLLFGWRAFAPNEDFDADFIMAYYPRTLAPGEHPFAFYCRHRDSPWCFPSWKAAQAAVSVVASSPLFSPTYVLRETGVSVEDVATYYCTEGFRLPTDPSPDFSISAYLLEYPDIATAELNPLLHYLEHGRAEGRLKFSLSAMAGVPGAQIFDPAKPSLLICSHEASRTGAPIVGLNLARHLGSRYNIFSMLLRGGALSEEFAKVSTELLISGDTVGQIEATLHALMKRRRIDSAVLNSVECTKLLPSLVKCGIPAVSLLHEFAQYVWPFNLLARAITLSDAVVFPSGLVEREGLKEAQRLGLGPMRPTNLHIRPQGRSVVPLVPTDRQPKPRLPPSLQLLAKAQDRPLIVLGAGQVQPRKGVDLFIEAVRILRHDLGVKCHFIWVGAGYAPKTDLGVSVYLADQIDRSDLADVVTFVPEQASLQPFWELADAFFMSSRLDPFPNVALDAIAEGVPLVCFQKATGIADLATRWPDRVHAAPYNDARNVAQVFAALAEKRRQGGSLRLPADADVTHLLSFPRYAADVAELVETATAKSDRRKTLAQSLKASPQFMPKLFETTLPDWLRSDGKHTWGRSDRLTDLAAISAINGVPVGYLWPGKIGALSPAATASDETWGEADFRAVPTGATDQARLGYRAIAFVDDQAGLDALTDALFQLVDVGHVAIVSTLLDEIDIATLRGTAGPSQVSFHLADPETIGKVLADLNARIGAEAPVHLIKSRADGLTETSKGQGVSLKATAIRSALSILASDQEVQIVLQQPDWSKPSTQAQTNRHSPSVESGGMLPDRLVDQTQAWIRLQPGGWTDDLLRDLLFWFASGNLDGVWDCAAARVRSLKPAQRGLIIPQLVEPRGSSEDAHDLASGRRVVVKQTSR